MENIMYLEYIVLKVIFISDHNFSKFFFCLVFKGAWVSKEA